MGDNGDGTITWIHAWRSGISTWLYCDIVIHNSGSKNYFYFQPLNYFISGSLIFADILRDRVQS